MILLNCTSALNADFQETFVISQNGGNFRAQQKYVTQSSLICPTKRIDGRVSIQDLI